MLHPRQSCVCHSWVSPSTLFLASVFANSLDLSPLILNLLYRAGNGSRRPSCIQRTCYCHVASSLHVTPDGRCRRRCPGWVFERWGRCQCQSSQHCLLQVQHYQMVVRSATVDEGGPAKMIYFPPVDGQAGADAQNPAPAGGAAVTTSGQTFQLASTYISCDTFQAGCELTVQVDKILEHTELLLLFVSVRRANIYISVHTSTSRVARAS